MAVKATAKVIIDGKEITLGGYESEEYFQRVAAFMNKKISELSKMPGYSRQPSETRHMLLSLNVTDEYLKAREQAESCEQDLQHTNQEMYELKHDLVKLRMENEELQKKTLEASNEKLLLEGKVRELEKQIDELLK